MAFYEPTRFPFSIGKRNLGGPILFSLTLSTNWPSNVSPTSSDLPTLFVVCYSLSHIAGWDGYTSHEEENIRDVGLAKPPIMIHHTRRHMGTGHVAPVGA